METNNNGNQFAKDIAAVLQDFQQSDAYRELITQHIKKMISDSLDEVFGWRGEYRKQFQQILKDAMPANIDNAVDLAKYNHLFFESLKNEWADNALPTQVVTKAKNIVQCFAEDFVIPEYVTMSKFIETFIECHSEDAAQECVEKPNILFKWENRSSVSQYFGIGIEFKEKSSSFSSYKHDRSEVYQFENNFFFSKRDGQVDGNDVYELFSGRLGKPLGSNDFQQFHGDFDKLVACFYYGGTRLVLDTEDVEDFYYPSCSD